MVGDETVATDRLGSVVYKGKCALENMGFESSTLMPWAHYGEAAIAASTVARTGAQSLRVTTPIVDRGVYQEVKGLVAGLTYQFQAWVRSESGTSLAALAVCDSSYNGFVWTGVQTVGTTWQMLSVTFTATGQGVARVHLAKHDTTGALLWDDVELVNGATAISGVKLRYYPYGQEVGTATPNDVAKFGTYTRDSGSGLDYAMNRYYMSTWGRFTSPDQGPAVPTNPLTWNRYSYTWNDPINLNDPDGLLPAAPPGCVAYPFGAPGGSIDTSTNCPPGYIEVDAWNTGSWTSLSPLRQLHDMVTLLEGLGVDVSRAPGGGYNLNFADARAAATTITICAAQPELCVIVAGGAAVVFTVYVTWPHLTARGNSQPEHVTLEMF